MKFLPVMNLIALERGFCEECISVRKMRSKRAKYGVGCEISLLLKLRLIFQMPSFLVYFLGIYYNKYALG